MSIDHGIKAKSKSKDSKLQNLVSTNQASKSTSADDRDGPEGPADERSDSDRPNYTICKRTLYYSDCNLYTKRIDVVIGIQNKSIKVLLKGF